MELDQARVRYLLPGVRRGFVISVVPIALIAVIAAVRDADGAPAWVALRLVLAAGLYVVVARLGDGLADARRTLRRLAVVLLLSSIGWGLLPIMVASTDLEWRTIVMFALIANVAIVTVQCAADRTVYLCAVVPVGTIGLVGLFARSADEGRLLPLLLVLALPYSMAIFVSANRVIVEGFEHERRNELLVAELGEREHELSRTNERLLTATAQQALLLDERAALLSTVGHDLGSPLGAAMLTAEVLADRPDAVTPEMQRQLAGRIKSQVHDALTVLRDLTSSQRLDGHDVEANRIDLDLRTVADLVTARHGGEGQEIVVRVPEGTVVWADPGLLERMLDNLVSNAVKYTPVTSSIEVGAVTEPGGVSMWVDDDGPGLPDELRDSVFDAYVRGPSPASTSGTGVGLFLVRSFALSHGGDVRWEPSPRGGSRFVIHLPARAVVEEPARAISLEIAPVVGGG